MAVSRRIRTGFTENLTLMGLTSPITSLFTLLLMGPTLFGSGGSMQPSGNSSISITGNTPTRLTGPASPRHFSSREGSSLRQLPLTCLHWSISHTRQNILLPGWRNALLVTRPWRLSMSRLLSRASGYSNALSLRHCPT